MRVSGWLYLIEQTLSGACLLLCIGRSAGQRVSPWGRLTATALLLALATMSFQALAAPLRMLLLLPTAMLAPLAVWVDAPRRLRPRMACLSPILSLTMAGMMRLLAPLRLPGLLLLTAGCAGLMLAIRLAARSAAVPQCTAVSLHLGGRHTTLTALVDTGNLLRDGLTGLPVIVVSRRTAARLTPLPPEGDLLPGMRLMTVRTISGTALMTILRPDSVRIRAGSVWEEVRALIGISPDGYEGFQALVPACLVSGEMPVLSRKAISQGG